MDHRIETDEAALAAAVAEFVARDAHQAAAARGRFTVAFSGGTTPWAMLARLTALDLPWSAMHVFQIDERAAPDGDATRNWTHLRAALLDSAPIPRDQLHPMPVEAGERGAADYARDLAVVCGQPVVLDLAQLGIGDDGHTASLVPGDPVVDIIDRDVAWTAAAYRGHRRMTLTRSCLDRARRVLWLAAGPGKAEMLARLVRGDPSIPAGRIAADRAVVWCDAAAGARLPAAHDTG